MASVPIVPRMKSAQIEAKALAILKNYCPKVLRSDMPTPVDAIFELYIPEKLNIRTYYTSLEDYGVTNAEGYTNARQRISIVDRRLIDDSSLCGRRRCRATSGHEAGHCFLHVSLNRWQQSLQIVGMGMKRERSDLKPYEDPEWQAWRFCHALCMPAQAVKRAVQRYGVEEDGISAMMERFDMNRSFVYARLRMLKIIPANR